MDIIITYETLFDILRKEKSREELQELADDFYLQSFAFIKSKMDDSEGNYDSREQIQLRNTKKILKELFERRERKIINLAIDSARTESFLVNKDAMTPREKAFFEEAVNFVKLHKMKIIGPVLTGVMPSDLPDYGGKKEEKKDEKKEEKESKETRDVEEEKSEVEENNVKIIASNKSAEEAVAMKVEDKITKLKVKITSSLPKFLGPNGEVLGPYDEGQETELPEKVALILDKKGKAKII